MKIIALVISFVASFSAAALGGLATQLAIPTWYAGLEKPFLNPPNWVFGPVWTLLYSLIAISLYLVITASSPTPKTKTYWTYAVQLLLNAAWSSVFFGFHQMWPAVAVIVLLIAAIVSNILSARKFSHRAGLLLIPYLAWVCFASYLTIAISVLN